MAKSRKKILEDAAKMFNIKDKADKAELLKSAEKLKALKNKKKAKIPFPVDAFPAELQLVMKEFNKAYGFPLDYYGLGFLTSAATVLGNAFEAQFMGTWTAKAILYGAIVGHASVGKTHALNTCMKPVYKIENDFRSNNKVSISNYRKAMSSWERDKVKDHAAKPEEPGQNEIYINEFTIEAVFKSLRDNPKGLLMFKDELSGWINGMNQYRKGTDQEFWLQNWSNVRVKIARSGKEAINIESPCISTLGALTPSFLTELAGNGRGDNGFLARVLFAYPDNLDKPPLTFKFPDESIETSYNDIINQMYKFPHHINRINSNQKEIEDCASNESIQIPLSEDAKNKYADFLEGNRVAINHADDNMIKSIYGKMDSYCLRFALILQMMQFACEELAVDSTDEAFEGANKKFATTDSWKGTFIDLKSLEGAIKLTSYFKSTAFKVVGTFDSPINQLPSEYQEWYNSLPTPLTTAIAVEHGAKAGLSETTVKRLLNNKRVNEPIFKQIGRAHV